MTADLVAAAGAQERSAEDDVTLFLMLIQNCPVDIRVCWAAHTNPHARVIRLVLNQMACTCGHQLHPGP